jgi:hypothetical protein
MLRGQYVSNVKFQSFLRQKRLPYRKLMAFYILIRFLILAIISFLVVAFPTNMNLQEDSERDRVG